MAIEITILSGGIGCIQPEGRLVGGDETDDLRHAAAMLEGKDIQRLVIDLTKVTFINSVGIGVLVSIHTTYVRREWHAVVCGLNPSLLNIFTITNLAMVFEVYGTRDDALLHLTEEPPP